MLKAGTTVRIRRTTLVGVVKERRFTAADEVECLVEWVDAATQEQHARWFAEAELDEVEQ